MSSNYRQLLREKDFEYLFAKRLPPPGRYIEIAYLRFEPRNAFRTRMSPVKVVFIPQGYDKQDVMKLVDKSSSVLTMQTGKLLMQVVGLPSLGMWARADNKRDDILRLYPRPPEYLNWPPEPAFEGSIDSLNTHAALRLLAA